MKRAMRNCSKGRPIPKLARMGSLICDNFHGRAQSSAKWVLGAALLIAAVVGGALAYIRLTSAAVVVTEAVEGPVVQAFYSTGTIQPDREFPIKANVAGILTSVLVDKGDRVKKD